MNRKNGLCNRFRRTEPGPAQCWYGEIGVGKNEEQLMRVAYWAGHFMSKLYSHKLTLDQGKTSIG